MEGMLNSTRLQPAATSTLVLQKTCLLKNQANNCRMNIYFFNIHYNNELLCYNNVQSKNDRSDNH